MGPQRQPGTADRAVADATVLIALAKIERLALLARLYGDVLLAPAIEVEVVQRGLELAAPEVVHVQQGLQDGWLSRTELSPGENALAGRLEAQPGIHRGEAEALALAAGRRRLLLADEKQARAIARALGIRVMGSAGILLDAYRAGLLTLRELEEAVKRLAAVLWLAPDIVVDILAQAREAEE